MRGQGPRIGGREEVILQCVRRCPRPVVRYLARVVEPHDVGLSLRPVVLSAQRGGSVHRAREARVDRRRDEAVHLSAVDIGPRCGLLMRTAVVPQPRVVIRRRACSHDWVRHARREVPVLGREPVGTRERAEVVIERSVFLHDEDNVLDVVEALQRLQRAGSRRRCRWRCPAEVWWKIPSCTRQGRTRMQPAGRPHGPAMLERSSAHRTGERSNPKCAFQEPDQHGL